MWHIGLLWSDRRRHRLGDHEHVPHTAECGEHRDLVFLVELAAQSAGIDVDDVGVRIAPVVPHLRHEFGSRDHAVCVARQMVKKGKLLGGEGNVPRPPACHLSASIDGQIADGEIGGEHLAAAAGEGTQSRQQLAKIEWFGKVVVGPGVESGNALLHRVERGEHENGHGAFSLPNGPADVEPVHARHEDVEDDGVVLMLREQRERGRAVGRAIDHVRCLTQSAGDGLAQLPIVFGQK